MKKTVLVVVVVILITLGVFMINKDKPLNDISNTNTSNTLEQAKDDVLNLAKSGISNIPTKTFDNINIKKLDVSGNNLTGSLPSEIGKLKYLEILDASDNNMTGIPAEIGQLSKLTSADFSNNNISGLPLEIGNLSNLRTLDLRGNPNVSKADIAKIKEQIPNTDILTD